ncbi:MAG: DNA-processing protein DprA [Candidatus Brocadiaceae bacterium]|jgi:DNA processing protein
MSLHKEQTLACLKLSLCEGVGNGAIHALVEHFGSAADALTAPTEELRAVPGVGLEVAEAIRRGPSEGDVERELELMERHRVRLVPSFSEEYPEPLIHLDSSAPALLRVKGDYLPEDGLAMAMVGSRRCSEYGRAQARRMAADLASMGLTIVSGLARGIDSAAHRGALRARGRTLAVLGQGLAHPLPPRRMELAEEIVSSGALLSELPMETPPRAANFPPRNRIISGLSLGVVVLEAASRSGSLITARHAGEQGRSVFAVPGNVDSPTSRGCHKLIRDGAVLVERARDVVEGLGPLSRPVELPTPEQADAPARLVEDPRVLALNQREQQIYDLVGTSAVHIDEIVARTELALSIVSSILLTLEIRGLIRQVSGQRYVRG